MGIHLVVQGSIPTGQEAGDTKAKIMSVSHSLWLERQGVGFTVSASLLDPCPPSPPQKQGHME